MPGLPCEWQELNCLKDHCCNLVLRQLKVGTRTRAGTKPSYSDMGRECRNGQLSLKAKLSALKVLYLKYKEAVKFTYHILMQIMMDFFFSIYLKELQRNRERQSKRSSMCWFPHHVATTTRMSQAKAGARGFFQVFSLGAESTGNWIKNTAAEN